MIQESLRGESWLTKEQDMLFDLKKKISHPSHFKKVPFSFPYVGRNSTYRERRDHH